VAFVPAALLHSTPFFASKALHFLVIDCRAFCAGVVIRGRSPVADGPSRSGAARTARSHPDRGVQFRIGQKPLERGVFTL
jgi:hypothetical protein